jgi:ketosteroid isomerase-like protein
VSAENVEIVRRLYEAYARGDFAAALELLDPEIEIEYRGIFQTSSAAGLNRRWPHRCR